MPYIHVIKSSVIFWGYKIIDINSFSKYDLLAYYLALAGDGDLLSLGVLDHALIEAARGLVGHPAALLRVIRLGLPPENMNI